MRTAQWTLGIFLAATLFLGGLQISSLRGEAAQDPASPVKGTLAPVFRPPPIERLRLRLLDPPGPLVDLDVDGPRIAVLARTGWALDSGNGFPEWHGEETAGSPTWLSPAESIALAGEVVFILEPQRSILSIWDTAGARLQEISIPVRRDLAQRATRVVLGPSNRPVVVLQGMNRDGTAYWEILELNRRGEVTGLVSLPTDDEKAIYREPQLAVHGPALLAMSTLSQELWAVDLERGQLHPIAQRRSPPLWPLPRAERRKHARVLSRMPSAMAAHAQLPDYWPTLREFTVQMDGTILQATAAGEEIVQLEQLSLLLDPLGRANLEGFSQPVFLARGRAFVAYEGVEETRVHEIIF